MIGFVYSTTNVTSRNMGEHLLKEYSFKDVSGSVFRSGNVEIHRIETDLPYYNTINSAGLDLVCFLCSHSSAEGIGAYAVHPMGNWGGEVKLGGEPKRLSVASPGAMLSVLRGLNAIESSITKTYEATHHGPLITRPSMFIELGGNDQMRGDSKLAGMAAEAAYNAVTGSQEYEKVAIGIGSLHYPSKFTKMALEKGYAFGHIMAKHAVLNADGSSNVDMLDQALSMSSEKPEVAVIEWKGLNSSTRGLVLKKLDEMGLDYEKV